ncbi:prolipoprotein diacylglyceryl transferase [bacterium]|nr:prolipoprotein diacylglyceryl transferase [bacterium]
MKKLEFEDRMMNEHIGTIGAFNNVDEPQSKVMIEKGDFGPVILYQGQAITFVSFGVFVSLGALLGLINTWFYLGAYQIIPNAIQANRLAIVLALGTPLSAYILTRLLDIKTWLSGEKIFIDYIRTVSFGLWGGLVGGLLILTIFAFVTHASLFALLDAFALGVPVAQVMGRLGCLNYGCCHGKECSSHHQPGIRYHNSQAKVLRYDPNLKGKRLHPTQIYSVLANMAIYGTILMLAILWETRPVGALAAVYMGLYGLKRFSVEFIRGEYPRVYFFGLTIWQWFSLSFVLQGLVIFALVIFNPTFVGVAGPGLGIQSLQSALGVLVLASAILGLAYGTHGRKIGSW